MFRRVNQRVIFSCLSILALTGNLAFADLKKGDTAYTAKDYKTAMAEYKKSADDKDPIACARLANIYEFGKADIKINLKESVKWYKKAAELGDIESQANLGVMYERGAGVKKNEKTAVEWYRKAAVRGNALGQYNLGVMYSAGKGVGKDYVEALMWANLAQAGKFGPAKKLVEYLFTQMTPDQIKEGDKRALEWKPGK